MKLKKELKPLIIVYLLLIVIVVVLIAIADNRSGNSLSTSWSRLKNLSTNTTFLGVFHILFLLVYLVFLSLRYIRRVYCKHGWLQCLKRTSLHIVLPVGLLIIGYHAIVGFNTLESYDFDWDYSVENKSGLSKNLYATDGKHRGMSVFGARGDSLNGVAEVVKDNIEWVAVIPFMDQKDEESPILQSSYTDTSRRRDAFTEAWIQRWHEKGVKVHLKPHIWLSNGWRSNIRLSDADWEIWFDTYHKTMVHYAKLAESNQVEMLCIGTELRTVIQKLPHKWVPLIEEIRAIYSGKLTYAANWDDPIDDIPFWSDLDYIGIQAYFPLTEAKSPSLEEIREGWQKHKEVLIQASKKYKLPILFTEVGYRSDVSATIAPWEWGNRMGALYNKKSDQTQKLAFEALFAEFWKESWFAGAYIWQWHTRTDPEKMVKDVDFTPRFKPAENVIAKWYGRGGEKVDLKVKS